jgi:hypothetical protein
MSIFNTNNYDNEKSQETIILNKVSENYLRKNGNDIATSNIIFNGIINNKL